MISCIVSRGSLVQQNQELICTSLIYVAELLVKQFMGIVSTLGELSSYDEFVQNAQKNIVNSITFHDGNYESAQPWLPSPPRTQTGYPRL